MNKNYMVSLIAVIVLFLAAYVGTQQGVGLQVVFGIIIPYLAVILFVVGFARRVMGWARSAVPFRITTTCGQQSSMPWIKQAKIDNPSSTLGVIIRMFLEIVTFRSLFRNTRMQLNGGTRLTYQLELFLWIGALAFHYAFFAVIVRHLRFFTEPVPFFVTLVEQVDGFMRMEVLYDSVQAGLPGVYMSGLVLFAAALYLFLRRVMISQVRYISLAADFFPLFLIMGITLSGLFMRYVSKTDIVAVKALTMGLVTFRPTIPEGVSGLFFAHMFLVSILLAYFPFSKLMHLGGIFLSPTRNMTGNTRQVRHVNPWNHPVKVHTYEEYEDDFREKMVEAGLPVVKMPEEQA
ncbi:sulfate reduction electron transfer complex DsrMKJOP subunit DsrM [Desulfosarcina sp.]|jgi:nitrate reductase gamma subunit|uniref:sulfate reduction electron transfer complex DsrMKJOP subunit DsrM n=1 Tax=Desulfosarcina sp. TaxID=2027861 RepID=UPI0039708AA4